jgi:Nucleotidyltransferase/DNA polymerase involved in DNA repair
VTPLERTILHCDLNGFYAAVECIFNPELRNIPMAVAGNAENRHGIILAKNELAKKYKIQTAETIWEAKKKCPGLVLVPPRHGEYTRYSKLVNDIYCEFSDRVEPFGIDESWLDVSGVTHLFGSGAEIADKIRETVKKRLGLTISVGVSFNKVFAKLGSDYKKPDATTIISRDNYRDIVWSLPASDLLYVGKATNDILFKNGHPNNRGFSKCQ